MPTTLVLSFELLKTLAAIDVVEAELEDPVVVLAAFADVGVWALGPGQILVVVEPEFSLFGSVVTTWTFDTSKDSALNIGAWVGVRSPEFDGIVDAHC